MRCISVEYKKNERIREIRPYVNMYIGIVTKWTDSKVGLMAA